MRWFFGVFISLLAIPFESEARECRSGSSSVFSVSEWTAQIGDRGEADFFSWVDLNITLQNQTETGIRMSEGIVFFDDVLERSISNIKLNPDAKVEASSSFEQSGRYYSDEGLERLISIRPEDVETLVCVTATVDANGTVTRY